MEIICDGAPGTDTSRNPEGDGVRRGRYQQYGSSDSARFDMYRYIAEKDACNHAYARDGVRLPRVLSAMFGSGDRILGVAGWGFLLIPLVLLWILSWGIGRFVIWIVAGFHRLVRRRKGLTAQ